MDTKDKFFGNMSCNDKIGFTLWKVNNYWQREFKKYFNKVGLTHSQFFLLLGIFYGESYKLKLNQKNLSHKSGIDPMTTSTVLRTMQKKGWITRVYNEKDTRTKIISTTESGKKIIEEGMNLLKIFNENFFYPLKDEKMPFLTNLTNLLINDEMDLENLGKTQIKAIKNNKIKTKEI